MNNDLTFETTFSNQNAIEFGYAIKDLIEPLIESCAKLIFEEANCYTHCFYHARELLSQVKPAHCVHESLREVFFNGYELDNSWDRLRWVKSKDNSEDEMEERRAEWKQCPF